MLEADPNTSATTSANQNPNVVLRRHSATGLIGLAVSLMRQKGLDTRQFHEPDANPKQSPALAPHTKAVFQPN